MVAQPSSLRTPTCAIQFRHQFTLGRAIGVWLFISLALPLTTHATESLSDSALLSDSEIENVLLNGKIIEIEDIGVGVTRPQKIQFRLAGTTLEASFKSVDERIAVAKFSDGTSETNFTDSYLYERAAYLLDRHLQLNMVPVTVLRTIRRSKGAVCLWVYGAVIETERREQHLSPPDPNRLKYQRDVMYIFDALIANTDRNSGNQLTTPADWKLHLIDHSRSFRQNKTLSSKFEERTWTLPRDLYDRLKKLNAADLKPLFKKILGGPTIKTLLIRRDKIVEKIERDRRELGDAAVFQDPLPSVPKAQEVPNDPFQAGNSGGLTYGK